MSGQLVPVALKLLQPVKPPAAATVSQVQMYQASITRVFVVYVLTFVPIIGSCYVVSPFVHL